MDYKEWKLKNDFNPFNTFKILKHIDYWKKISLDNLHELPSPIAVTVDPTNACNYRCIGCNAYKAIHERSSGYISKPFADTLIKFLSEWGVRAVTFAGGGEPLLHFSVMPVFFNDCRKYSMPFGLITNGSLLDKYSLSDFEGIKWIGVSVDASTRETYSYTKNVESDKFGTVIKNIEALTKYGYDVTYKYLVNKYNISEIYMAVKLAKAIGCKNIHIRPLGNAWYEDRKPIFSKEDVEISLAEVTKARMDFEDENFSVFGVTHKFDKNWKVNNCFEKCWATFMYLVVEPGGIISTCCDNRGNEKMQLASGLREPSQITEYWGSDKHLELFKSIDVRRCPRCTFSLHNQCYENCVLKDEMMFDFI